MPVSPFVHGHDRLIVKNLSNEVQVGTVNQNCRAGPYGVQDCQRSNVGHRLEKALGDPVSHGNGCVARGHAGANVDPHWVRYHGTQFGDMTVEVICKGNDETNRPRQVIVVKPNAAVDIRMGAAVRLDGLNVVLQLVLLLHDEAFKVVIHAGNDAVGGTASASGRQERRATKGVTPPKCRRLAQLTLNTGPRGTTGRRAPSGISQACSRRTRTASH